MRKRFLAFFFPLLLLGSTATPAAAETPRETIEGRGTFWGVSATDAHGNHPIRESRWLWLAFGSEGTFGEDGKEEAAHTTLVWEHTCNEHFYDVQVTSNRFLLKGGGSSLVGCSSDEDPWLERFFGANPHWRLHRGTLILTAPAGRITMHPNARRNIRERFE